MSISSPPGAVLQRAGSAHLADDCFRESAGLGADDSFGDDGVASAAAGGRALGRRCSREPSGESGMNAIVRGGAPSACCGPLVDCPSVSAEEVDEYLQGVDEPKRSTLQALRRTILEIVPDAEQVISYRVPAFRVAGRTVAGFAAFRDHLSYLPFSGSVLQQLSDQLKGYTMTKSALHFPVDRPLPKTLVKKLIAVRLGEIRQGPR